MSNAVLLDRPRPVDTRATDFATWDATHLRVRDIDRALTFWRDLLGLQISRGSGQEFALGVEDAELIVLHPGAQRPTVRGHSGLYHVALHLPTAKDFAETYARLVTRRVDPRPTDHLLHWAMYLFDSDGIGVEITFETADRFDHVIPGVPPVLVGTDGHRQGPVEPLAMQPIMEAFSSLETDRPMAPGTRVGHNHLHVGDLAAAARFYEQLGFDANPSIMGMGDFNAGGSFPHRLAVNEWQGHGAPPAPQDAAGLHHLQLTYANNGALQEALINLERRGMVLPPIEHPLGVSVHDPSGNTVALSVQAV